jgi:hypothetical protein
MVSTMPAPQAHNFKWWSAMNFLRCFRLIKPLSYLLNDKKDIRA